MADTRFIPNSRVFLGWEPGSRSLKAKKKEPPKGQGL